MKKHQESSKNSTRREFFKTTALGAGIIGALGSFSFVKETLGSISFNSETSASKDLHIKLAGYDFNRVKAIVDGRVKINGCSTTFVKAGIGDMNTNVFSGPQSYDVTEIGLHPFMLAYANVNFFPQYQISIPDCSELLK